MAGPVIWSVRAGHDNGASELLCKWGYAAMGWPALGDLSRLGPDPETFKNAVAAKVLGDADRAALVPVVAGQLWRFLHHMKPGDVVLYSSKQDRQVHLGRVDGPYEHSPLTASDYPNLRKVTWTKVVDQSAFSPAAQLEMGFAYDFGPEVSLFCVAAHAGEVTKHLVAGEQLANGLQELHGPGPQPAAAQNLRDAGAGESTAAFVRREIATRLQGPRFVDFVAEVLRTMGFTTRLPSTDFADGFEVAAPGDALGVERPHILVRAKDGAGRVEDAEVLEFLARLRDGESGLLVAFGGYSPQAAAFARNHSRLRLIGGDELVALVIEHYEQLLPEYQGLIGLRRVHVPAEMFGGNYTEVCPWKTACRAEWWAGVAAIPAS